jgi:hypothetical protein
LRHRSGNPAPLRLQAKTRKRPINLPQPGTGEGKYVVDGQMEGIGLVDEPIVWTVKRGRAVEIK